MNIEYIGTVIANKTDFEKVLNGIRENILGDRRHVVVDRLILTADFEAALSRVLSEECSTLRKERFANIQSVSTVGKTLSQYIKNDKVHFDIILDSCLGQHETLLFDVFAHELLHIAVADVFIETRGVQAYYEHDMSADRETKNPYNPWRQYEEFFVGRTINMQGQVFHEEPEWYIEGVDLLLEAIRRGRALSQSGMQAEADKALYWAFKDLNDRFMKAAVDVDSTVVEKLLQYSVLTEIFGDGWTQLNSVFCTLFQKKLASVTDEDLCQVTASYNELWRRMSDFCLQGQY